MELKISQLLVPFDGCAPAVAEGIKQFSAEIELQQTEKTRSFSLTSRNSSIWSLMRRHLDAPIDNLLSNYQGIFLRELLAGFRLSETGKSHPRWGIDVISWSKTKRDDHIYRLEECCNPLTPKATKQKQNNSEKNKLIDWKSLLKPLIQESEDNPSSNIRVILHNIEAWDLNLRFAIHSMIDARDDCVSRQERSQFMATLDSIRTLLSILDDFLPQTGNDPTLQLYDDQHALGPTRNDRYCELCWRKTIRTVELNRIYNSTDINILHLESIYRLLHEGRTRDRISEDLRLSVEVVNQYTTTIEAIQEAKKLSNNLCYEHIQSDTKSRYHADKYHKEAFHQELVLQKANTSRYAFRLIPPHGADQQELRKTAYDQVHSGIPLHSQFSNKKSLLEKILDLHQQRLTDADIARTIGVSRTAVSREKNKLKKLLKIRHHEQYVCPMSEESWQKRMDFPLVQQVIDLHKKGYTVADIANNTDRFKHTIHSVHNWLNLTPNKPNPSKPRLRLCTT